MPCRWRWCFCAIADEAASPASTTWEDLRQSTTRLGPYTNPDHSRTFSRNDTRPRDQLQHAAVKVLSDLDQLGQAGSRSRRCLLFRAFVPRVCTCYGGLITGYRSIRLDVLIAPLAQKCTLTQKSLLSLLAARPGQGAPARNGRPRKTFRSTYIKKLLFTRVSFSRRRPSSLELTDGAATAARLRGKSPAREEG